MIISSWQHIRHLSNSIHRILGLACHELHNVFLRETNDLMFKGLHTLFCTAMVIYLHSPYAISTCSTPRSNHHMVIRDVQVLNELDVALYQRQ